ncbi:MAG: DUF305 domain-containing protein, partial [Bacteroidota bacterium]|nr:DUF305 domain-containing protein [Bacteroidota bacterium]
MEVKNKMHDMQKMSYKKFVLMILVSFIFMYGIMFLNIVELNHFYISINRIYLAILMASAMAIIMMAMMYKMYPNKKRNNLIMIISLVIFAFTLAGVRTQTPISDVQYMKAMIPHHSSAILTSENANIKDPEVRKLADGIIEAQVK